MDYSYYPTAAHQAPMAFFNAPPQTYDIPDDPLPNGHVGSTSSSSDHAEEINWQPEWFP